jgi:hypothetical protein
MLDKYLMTMVFLNQTALIQSMRHSKMYRNTYQISRYVLLVEKVYRYTPSSDFDKNVPPVNIEVVIHSSNGQHVMSCWINT